jgi:hypothetical protein
VCEVLPEQRSAVSLAQIATVALFAVLVGSIAPWIYRTGPRTLPAAPPAGSAMPAAPIDPAEVERCGVPDFAKAIGHEEKWKLHHNCR